MKKVGLTGRLATLAYYQVTELLSNLQNLRTYDQVHYAASRRVLRARLRVRGTGPFIGRRESNIDK
jgi:hypothetical protein